MLIDLFLVNDSNEHKYAGKISIKGKTVLPFHSSHIYKDSSIVDVYFCNHNLPVPYNVNFLHDGHKYRSKYSAVISVKNIIDEDFPIISADDLHDNLASIPTIYFYCNPTIFQKLYFDLVFEKKWIFQRRNVKDFLWPSITAIIGWFAGQMWCH